jgi:hypothetical protein
MNPDSNDFRDTTKELRGIEREVTVWRDRLQTVLGLVHAAETDGERVVAASLARRLHDHMVIAAKRIHAFARRLGELAEQLEEVADASDGQQQPRKE